MKKQVILCGFWLASCGAPAVGVEADRVARSEAQTSEVGADAESEQAARAALHARIDARKLYLEPLSEVRQSSRFDAQAARMALEAASGSSLQAEWQASVWQAESAAISAKLDGVSGELEVSTAEEFARGLKQAPDAQFLAGAQSLFRAFAADTAGAEVDLKHVGVTDMLVGDTASQTDTRIATKVFAFRTLGGMRVAGHRMIATYKTDGTLLGLRGRWPTLDIARSQLKSTLTRTEVLAKAVDVLMAAGVRTAGTDPIRVESYYEPRETPDGWVVVLRAGASAQTIGPDGNPGRIERHDFDI